MITESVENNKLQLVIIMPRKYYSEDEIKAYPMIKHLKIEPKNFDGSEIVQLFIEVAEISIPAISAYLVGKRNSNSIIVKYTDEKISAEIKSHMSNKKINQLQLQDYLEKILNSSISKNEGKDDESNH